MDKNHIFTVTEPGRLDKAVTAYLESLSLNVAVSRNQIEKLIAAGLILVNGTTPTKSGSALRVGDTVECRFDVDQVSFTDQFAPHAVIAKPMALEILFEDDSLLVINKAADVVVHPGAGNSSDTLLNGLQHYFTAHGIAAPDARFGLVHRLDKDTTGVLLIAKTFAALVNLQQQFADRTTKKIYLCLAFIPPRGRHVFRDQDSGVITSGIKRSAHNRLKMESVPRTEDLAGGADSKASGKFSVTEWRILERGNNCGWIEVQIKTGRTHQIRVHIESQKSGIIGDTLYNQWCRLPKDMARIADAFGRQALHAHQLTIMHPVTKLPITFTAPVPNDLKKLKDTFLAAMV